MWITTLKIRHDCTIGNRCKRFKCTSLSLPLNKWHDTKYYYTSHRHTLEGSQRNIMRFIRDLKKDSRIINIEHSGNTIFIVEKRKREDIPTAHYNPRMFFVKPVFVDIDGAELWEVASLEKRILIKFISDLKNEKGMEVKLNKIQNVNLNDVYFPRIMPNLSNRQKECFHLAVANGYYAYPRNINLQTLARLANISVSTFQEHLRKAEEKFMPSFS